jgi:hypothetical protein
MVRESSWEKERHNPIDLMKSYWPDAKTNHITYDPEMISGEYMVIESTGHDGTLYFTIQMFEKALVRFLNMQTHYKPTTPSDWNDISAIHYTIGPIKHAIVYKRIRLKCSRTNLYHGLIESIRIPTKCEYIKKEGV